MNWFSSLSIDVQYLIVVLPTFIIAGCLLAKYLNGDWSVIKEETRSEYTVGKTYVRIIKRTYANNKSKIITQKIKL